MRTFTGVGNLIESNAGSGNGFTGTIASTDDPNLGALADNGGPTRTIRLNVGSPAINAGDNAAASTLTNDQRGTPFARAFGSSVDIGGFEAQTFNLVVDTIADVPQNGHTTLREAVALANINPGADNISFDPSLAGETIVLSTLGRLTISGTIGETTITGPKGTLAVRESTIVNNVANFYDFGGAGGGVFSSGTGTVTIHNAIVAGNFVGSGASTPDDITGSVTANYSLIGTTTGATITGGNNVNGDPLFGPLANNGGPTQTHALLVGSPAINASDPSTTGLPANDQRGSPWLPVSGGRADIGALELQAINLVVDTMADVHVDGDLTLREAVALANANPGADNITIDPSLAGQTITLSQGQLVVNDTTGLTTITGPTGGLTIHAGGSTRSFLVGPEWGSHGLLVQPRAYRRQ